MTRTSFTLYISGVGGQGILWLSKVIAKAACISQPFVCRTEMRGLSQRGGSVCSAVRFGSDILTPTCAMGGADLIVALDALEAARSLGFLKTGGRLLTNVQFSKPAHLSAGSQSETELLKTRLDYLWEQSPDFYGVDFQALAEGNPAKRMNVWVAGAASAFLTLDPGDIRNVVQESVPTSERDVTEMAFDAAAAFMRRLKRDSQSIPHRAA